LLDIFPLPPVPLEVSSNAPVLPSSTRQRQLGVTTQISNALRLLYLVPQLLGWQEASLVVNARLVSSLLIPALKFCSFPLRAHSRSRFDAPLRFGKHSHPPTQVLDHERSHRQSSNRHPKDTSPASFSTRRLSIGSRVKIL
jgi:hypothetical protein